MKNKTPIYIATVCLERNRWGSREPSFKVGEWLERFAADGFDGVELWEPHYTKVDDLERRKLCLSKIPLAFNSYIGFSDEETEARNIAAQAITKLGAHSVKYNLGKELTKLNEYRRNLNLWAEALPPYCNLLCECHSGTVLEKFELAFEFHKELDADRFGIIVHPMEDLNLFRKWLEVFGGRVRELHMQFRRQDDDPFSEAGHEKLKACACIAKEHGFQGFLTIEFTRGISSDEKISDIYLNACKDMRACRELF